MEKDSTNNQIKLENIYQYLTTQTLKLKKVTTDKERHFIMVKGSNNQEDIAIGDTYIYIDIYVHIYMYIYICMYIYIYIYTHTHTQSTKIYEAKADRIKDVHN